MKIIRHAVLLGMLGAGLLFTARVMAAVTMAPTDLSGVRVLPNPWRSDRHASGPVSFDSFGSQATIKIFTVSGRWVRTIAGSGPRLDWDLRNSSGDRIASGIYLYLLTTDDGGKKTGQIVIIQ
jgi:hypothetical protein